jgi:23S rRNA (pseudouridine1915-N3)-methyltransferase
MKCVLLSIGKTDDKRIAELTSEYAAKICHYVPFELVSLPDIKKQKNIDEEKQKQMEGEKLHAYLKPGDTFVLLDDKGREFGSKAFAGQMQKWMNTGAKRLVIAVGGPYGFSGEVYSKADFRLSLSKMTLTHQMVRLFAAEQIYRAMTILRGEPYHHE